jgi:hypothetical protein
MPVAWLAEEPLLADTAEQMIAVGKPTVTIEPWPGDGA